MHFLIIGRDGTDPQAPARRLAVREQHLATFDRFYQAGVFQYGAALLNEEGEMAGSVIACTFDSREDLQEQWLKQEPYVIGGVWQTIEIHPIRPRQPEAL